MKVGFLYVSIEGGKIMVSSGNNTFNSSFQNAQSEQNDILNSGWDKFSAETREIDDENKNSDEQDRIVKDDATEAYLGHDIIRSMRDKIP